MTKAKRIELIKTAYDAGISSFDHADIYGNYTTEKDFGIAFSESGLSRRMFSLSRNVEFHWFVKTSRIKPNIIIMIQAYIADAVHTSLRQLKTDYVDLLLLHRPSLLDPEEVTKAIGSLLDSGKILSFGVSNFNSTQIDLLAEYVPIHVNQIEISLTHNDHV